MELYPPAKPSEDPEDCGMCLRASDIGVPVSGNPVAHVHPGCPYHGNCYQYREHHVDSMDRGICECGAYRDEHHFGAAQIVAAVLNQEKRDG